MLESGFCCMFNKKSMRSSPYWILLLNSVKFNLKNRKLWFLYQYKKAHAQTS